GARGAGESVRPFSGTAGSGAAGVSDGQVSASAMTSSQRRRFAVGSSAWDGFIGPPNLLPRGPSPERNRRRGAGETLQGKGYTPPWPATSRRDPGPLRVDTSARGAHSPEP